MMNKNTLKYSFIAVIMLLLSCKKYEQDYKLKPLNTVKITTPIADGRYSIESGAMLQITPTITESIPSNAEYTYEWRVLEQSTTKNWVISTEKNLNVKIDIPVGIYYLGLKLTNKANAQSYTFQGMLTIISPYNAGYYVTSNAAGKGKLSFIRASDDKLTHSIAELANSKLTYPGKALQADNYDKLLYYFTDQGIYRFNANDLLENGRNADVLEGAKKFTSGPVGFAGGSSNWDAFMVGDGGLYAGMGTSAASFYGNQLLVAPFSSRLVGDYSLFNKVFANTSTTYFYDNKYKRFMQCASQTRDLVLAPITPAAPTGFFNMADVGMTMVAADDGRVANEFYYLMENASGARYLLGTLSTAPNRFQAISNSPDIDKANIIASSALVNHVYYATANKVYVYDISANSSRLVYTFPASYVIKDMKMDRATSKRLVIGVSKSASEGEVQFFELDNIGSIVNDAPVKIFTGFGDIASINPR